MRKTFSKSMQASLLSVFLSLIGGGGTTLRAEANSRYVGVSVSFDRNEYWAENPTEAERDLRFDVEYGYNLLYHIRNSVSAGYAFDLKGNTTNKYVNLLYNLYWDIPFDIKGFNLFVGVFIGQQWVSKREHISLFALDARDHHRYLETVDVDYMRNSSGRGLLYGYKVGLTYKINENMKLDYTWADEQTEYLFSVPNDATISGFERNTIVETVSRYVNRITFRYYF